MNPHRQYDAYRSSSAEWLGAVPTHWSDWKLKHLFKEKKAVKGGTVPAGAISFGEVVEKEMLNEETLATYQEVLPGEFLLNPINLNYDLKSLRVAHSNIAVRVSPAYIVLRDLGIATPRFLRWAMYLFDVSHMKTLGAGVRQTITFNEIGNTYLALPGSEEQENIAALLDRETARIDALIQKKARFIALLKEKRQALITQAVTKGLDPTVPMKYSGVESIGDVPAHWAVPRLRWQAAIQSGIPLGGKVPIGHTKELPYLRVANVQDGHFKLEIIHTVTVERRQVDRYRLRVGDVLMNEGGDNDKLGRGAVWTGAIDPCLHQNHVFAVRPTKRLLADWLALCSQSLAAKAHFRIHAKQSTNLASISSTNIKELQIPMPPKEEQAEILRRLDVDTGRIGTLLTATNRSIELLRERRSALITAAVTGQIDLRENAA